MGAPVAAADDDPLVEALVDPLVVPPVDPAVVLLVEDLLLDEQAPTSRATVTAAAPYESFLFVSNFRPLLQPPIWLHQSSPGIVVRPCHSYMARLTRNCRLNGAREPYPAPDPCWRSD
jgi:hypothetical protein